MSTLCRLAELRFTEAMKTASLVILSFVLSSPVAAQWIDHPTPGIPRTADGKPNLAAPAPRTADGKPDLSGVWTRTSRTNSGFKPVDPASVDAVVRKRNENFGKESWQASCLPLGPGYLFATGPDQNFAMTKMIQTPGLIVVLSPDLTYRQIFMDGRALEADPNPSWMGYSVGHWEGDTLVVESAGFNDRTWLVGAYPHTEGLRAVERYRRSDFGHLTIEVELRDPELYAAPGPRRSKRVRGGYGAARIRVQREPDVPRALGRYALGRRSDPRSRCRRRSLAKYAGTYTEVKPFWQDAAGRASLRDQARRRRAVPRCDTATPQSETVFINSGLAIEFVGTARARRRIFSTSTSRAITDSIACERSQRGATASCPGSIRRTASVLPR